MHSFACLQADANTGRFLLVGLSTVQNDNVNRLPSSSLSFAGRVATGVGLGAGFTRLDWAYEQFLQHWGIDPFPGTLNLILDSEIDREAWRRLQARRGQRMAAPNEACDAILHSISIADTVTGAIVVPEVDGYPTNQVEIVAAINLRQHLSVADGDVVRLASYDWYSPQAIIFDVDGTLLNSLDGYQLAASRATEAYGYSVSQADVRQALNSNQPFWDFIIPPDRQGDKRLIAELRAATMRHWPDAMNEVVDVIPGCGDVLTSLRQAGTRLAIYTGSNGESFPPLRKAGLLDLFEIIITGKDVQARKPDPEGIQLCLDKLGLEPQEAAYIGDSCIDVTASRAAGVAAVSVLTGAGDSASLTAAGTHRILSSVARLPDVFVPISRL
ncbi:MAG: hypothetical protein CL797_01055 [Chromatiales bacterium]|jgi:HAD superfamily hydrolase (TIGR01509 family)|nr:hypothetical protein [Chromatiales bacterium]